MTVECVRSYRQDHKLRNWLSCTRQSRACPSPPDRQEFSTPKGVRGMHLVFDSIVCAPPASFLQRIPKKLGREEKQNEEQREWIVYLQKQHEGHRAPATMMYIVCRTQPLRGQPNQPPCLQDNDTGEIAWGVLPHQQATTRTTLEHPLAAAMPGRHLAPSPSLRLNLSRS